MSNFIFIFIYLFLGYVFSKTSLFQKNIPNILNKIVIYFSLPAMILLQIPKLEITAQSTIPVVIAWSVILLSALCVIIISKYFSFSKDTQGILLLLVPLGNTSFLGIPIIQSYYGSEVLPYVLIYDQLGTFLALATYGTFILSIYSSETKVNVTMILKKLFTFPPFIFLLFAFALIDVTYTPILQSILELLASTIVPFAVVAVGMQLKFILPKDDIKPLSVALILKLICAPIIAILLCSIFNWNGEVATISILEAGMAPMITAGAMASIAGFNQRLISSILGYGILLSFVSTYILYVVL